METRSFEHSLTVRHSQGSIESAKAMVLEGMKGEQNFLRTRYPKLNKLLLAGFRFTNFVLICGLSGGGKSMFLNILHRDFLNPELNGKVKFPFRILHFSFEMAGEDEILRSACSKVKKSYGDLLSAEKLLTQEECDSVLSAIDTLGDDRLYYVDKPGNRAEIRETIYKFQAKFPNDKLIITLDHSLLVKYLDEKDEVQLLAELGKLFIDIRKDLGALIIVLGQLNDKIEAPQRRDPSMNYPTKTDIHGSKQIYHAADTILVLHRPEIIHLDFYGRKQYPTTKMLFLHCLKQRGGDVGMVRFQSDFANGMIHEFNDEMFTV